MTERKGEWEEVDECVWERERWRVLEGPLGYRGFQATYPLTPFIVTQRHRYKYFKRKRYNAY